MTFAQAVLWWLGVLGCWTAAIANVVYWRRNRATHLEDVRMAVTAAVACTALVERSMGWLQCDTCGTTLGPDTGLGFVPDLDARGGARVLCGACGRVGGPP